MKLGTGYLKAYYLWGFRLCVVQSTGHPTVVLGKWQVNFIFFGNIVDSGQLQRLGACRTLGKSAANPSERSIFRRNLGQWNNYCSENRQNLSSTSRIFASFSSLRQTPRAFRGARRGTDISFQFPVKALSALALFRLLYVFFSTPRSPNFRRLEIILDLELVSCLIFQVKLSCP